jgi:tetratricopeptide (TPR) repeat protein
MKAGVLIDKINILIHQRKIKEATGYAEDAISHDPKNISLYNALGKMYGEQQMYDKALEIYSKAAAIEPNNFSIATGIGIIKYDQGVDKYKLSVADGTKPSDEEKYKKQANDIWKDATKDLLMALTLPHTNANREDLGSAYKALSQMYYQMNDPANGKKYGDLYKGL